MNRVVITGVGAVSPLGNDVDSLLQGIEEGRSAVRYMDGWDQYTGLQSLIAAPAELKDEKRIPRKRRRSMGRMSIFAVQAAEQAFNDAGIETAELSRERIGCIVGSTMGSAGSIAEAFEIMLPEHDLSNLKAMLFFHCVSHTAAMNVAQYFGITGPVMATSAACASGLQAIGTGYNLIKWGEQDLVVCGGTEELHPTVTGSFDILFATSTQFNDHPGRSPRPFDSERDGLVCGEGSGIVLLEEYEHARRRNARIYGEVIGFHTCASRSHVSQSNSDSIVKCLTGCLEKARLSPEDIDYISAHATGTIQGDKEEAEGIRSVFGDTVPTSSLKGYMGHLLAASGPIELIASLSMLKEGTIYPTLNLENVSSDCDGIQHIKEKTEKKVDVFVKNSFAFGGINAALVCRK